MEEDECKRLFRATRASAERVGIVWRLSLQEFSELWRPHWDERKQKRLILARSGYAGAYESGNVSVDTRSNHVYAQHLRRRAERDKHHKTRIDTK
jgi:hypothetical protein